jgi:2-phosphosulfolactate phosphatase
MSARRVKKVVIDCFPESVERYREDFAIVGVDVIQSTTTAITAAAMGNRCLPVTTIEDALSLAKKLKNPLLVGKLIGNMPYGFDMTNSPAQIADGIDRMRPVILLSSSGAQLISDDQRSNYGNYIACFRNFSGTAKYLRKNQNDVAIIGAGTRGEFREEDQMCCAWIAEHLLEAGFIPVDVQTVEFVKRWSGASPEACLCSNSVQYLRRTGQERDLEFILAHIDDIDAAFEVKTQEVFMLPNKKPRSTKGRKKST